MFRTKSLSRCGCGAQTRPCQLYFTSSLAISMHCGQNWWQGPHTRTHTDRAGIKRQESSEKCGPPHKMKRDVPLWSSEPARPAGAFNKANKVIKWVQRKTGLAMWGNMEDTWGWLNSSCSVGNEKTSKQWDKVLLSEPLGKKQHKRSKGHDYEAFTSFVKKVERPFQ